MNGDCSTAGGHVEDPLDTVYLEHAPLLRRLAAQRFRVPPADVDALVHDVFATMFANTRPILDLRAYLVGGICNASRQYWRKRDRERQIFADADHDNELPGPGELNDLTRKLAVAATLARMGERCREILRRYYFEGEVPQMIALAVNTSARNVIYQLHACRKRAGKLYKAITSVETT